SFIEDLFGRSARFFDLLDCALRKLVRLNAQLLRQRTIAQDLHRHTLPIDKSCLPKRIGGNGLAGRETAIRHAYFKRIDIDDLVLGAVWGVETDLGKSASKRHLTA